MSEAFQLSTWAIDAARDRAFELGHGARGKPISSMVMHEILRAAWDKGEGPGLIAEVERLRAAEARLKASVAKLEKRAAEVEARIAGGVTEPLGELRRLKHRAAEAIEILGGDPAVVRARALLALDDIAKRVRDWEDL